MEVEITALPAPEARPRVVEWEGGGRQEVGEGLYPAAFADRNPPDECAVRVFDEPS